MVKCEVKPDVFYTDYRKSKHIEGKTESDLHKELIESGYYARIQVYWWIE